MSTQPTINGPTVRPSLDEFIALSAEYSVVPVWREVLMFAWMNRESLRRTLETGRTWFWSRSRREFWCKGETSGDRQYVRAGYYDCDMDVLLFVVEQEGRGACHTGEHSCFFRAFGGGAAPGPL